MTDETPDVVKILLTFADGTVGVMQFITDDKNGVTNEPTDENIQTEIRKLNESFAGAQSPEALAKYPVSIYRIISDDEVPADREFRNAWRDDGDKIFHDMPTARKIHLSKLRTERADVLAKKDVEFSQALGKKDTTKADKIEGERQKLRDMPQLLAPLMDAAADVETLKAISLKDL